MSLEVNTLITHYHSHSPIRDPRLFSHFLVPGYKMTTLNSVSKSYEEKVLMAKLNLGMFITLIDDLADNPQFFNPKLLQHLYQLLPGRIPLCTPHLSKEDRATYELGKELITNLYENIRALPHYTKLISIFIFDLEQIYLANRYSELLNSHSDIANLKESQNYGHYNMGIVAAGMIDLMGCAFFELGDLGMARECFLSGQRMGRIGNLIATYPREERENDLTNEITISKIGYQAYTPKLIQEFARLKQEITQTKLSSFNTHDYAHSMQQLFELHMNLLGVI
jgi:hypothetical protein